jgi:hypothetical protein
VSMKWSISQSRQPLLWFHWRAVFCSPGFDLES